MNSEDYDPVRVHLVSAEQDVQLAAAPAPGKPRKVRKITSRTIILTNTSQVRDLLSDDLTRTIAWVQATGADVVLCSDNGQANDKANTTTGLPAPNGTLLPHANTAPWPLETTSRMWVASPAAATAYVSLTIINETDAT